MRLWQRRKPKSRYWSMPSRCALRCQRTTTSAWRTLSCMDPWYLTCWCSTSPLSSASRFRTARQLLWKMSCMYPRSANLARPAWRRFFQKASLCRLELCAGCAMGAVLLYNTGASESHQERPRRHVYGVFQALQSAWGACKNIVHVWSSPHVHVQHFFFLVNYGPDALPEPMRSVVFRS